MTGRRLVSLAGRVVIPGLMALALVTATPVQAADDDVITKMSAGRIERIMASFNDVKNFKEAGNNLYTFETAGLKIVLHNGGETLQIAAFFTGKATLSRLNEWNRTKKFSRAYLDKDDNVCLDHVMELTGGVTEKNVKEWMGTFVSCLKEFKKHLAE